MNFDAVDKLAEGRIWSGIDAVEIGLADTLGNLEVAIEIAADSAGIEDFRILEYPSQKEAFEKFLDLLYSDIRNGISVFSLNEPYNKILEFAKAVEQLGIQARLPFRYRIY